ncbi:hypothetical protein ACA910_019949 [Epithemia clementina (nom. ined.)]
MVGYRFIHASCVLRRHKAVDALLCARRHHTNLTQFNWSIVGITTTGYRQQCQQSRHYSAGRFPNLHSKTIRRERRKDFYIRCFSDFGGDDGFDKDDQFSAQSRRRGGSPAGLMSSNIDDDDDSDGKDWFKSDNDDGDDDDEEDGDDDDDFYDADIQRRRAREEAILERKREYENKKTRGWIDDMKAMEEVYMANPSLEDLPDWTPDCVSQTSRDRVKIHPDKIPSLTQLSQLPLPLPVYKNPGHGYTKEYTGHRRRMIYNKVLAGVRAKAKPRVEQIQTLPTWEEKQIAVDKLFEEIEAELKKEEVILGRQPKFGEWVEQALEEYLIEVDEKSKETLYQQVAETVFARAGPQIEHMETLATVEEKEKAFGQLTASVIQSFRSQAPNNINPNTNLGNHPLFSQWVARAVEAFISKVRKESEDALFEKVSESVKAKTKRETLEDIQKLLEPEDKAVALEELAGVLHDEMSSTTFDGKRYNFLKWLKKLNDDNLYQQVASAVRQDATSLPLEAVQDQEAQRRMIHMRSKILQHKFELAEFPLSKHEMFLNWLKRALEETIDGSQKDMFQKVAAAVVPRLESQPDMLEQFRSLESLSAKWTLLDELACTIQDELFTEKLPLSEHYQFDKWVKQALKEHLQKLELLPLHADGLFEERVTAPLSMIKRSLEDQLLAMRVPDESDFYPTLEQDEVAEPVFMDCYGPGCSEQENVPDILRPLRFIPNSLRTGHMIEEWELTAAKDTKRIMLRPCTRRIAQLVKRGETTPQRILVHGARGIGKTAALAAIVASARSSGHIVYFVPDTRRLIQYGEHNVVNKKREGMFDLPIMAQRQCKLLRDTHETDLEPIVADHETMSQYFSEKRMELFGEASVPVVQLLKLAEETEAAASACYSCVLQVLMTQDIKPFTMVVDDINLLYHTHGYYYNEEYDPLGKKTIPHDKLTLFEPILRAAGMSVELDGENIVSPVLMKKGSMVMAMSMSHGVPRLTSDAFMVNARLSASTKSFDHHGGAAAATNAGRSLLNLVEVPRLSKLEVEHMLANYEATGMGLLRLDEGAVVTNPQEVEFFRMVSGSNPRNLMNACVDMFP